MFQAYFQVFYPLLVEGELMTIEDSLLSEHGYQFLSIATSYFVGNNRDLLFGVFYSLLVERITIEDPSLSAHG